MLRGWRNLTPALGLLALAAWLPIMAAVNRPPGAAGDGVQTATAERVRGPEPGAYPWLQPGQAVWYAGTRQKLVALTFEGGLAPDWTPRLLAVLARHQARATFFLTGEEVQRQPDLARALVARGHEVGSRGLTGTPPQGHSGGAIAADLRLADAVIAGATGQRPRLFRPPGGGVEREAVTAASGLGYRTVFWSDAPTRAQPGRGPVTAVSPGDILRVAADPGEGGALQAVEALLSELTRQGYRCVTVSELLAAR